MSHAVAVPPTPAPTPTSNDEQQRVRDVIGKHRLREVRPGLRSIRRDTARDHREDRQGRDGGEDHGAGDQPIAKAAHARCTAGLLAPRQCECVVFRMAAIIGCEQVNDRGPPLIEATIEQRASGVPARL